MAFDFPSSPALNDTYTSGGVTYKWNGSGWVATSSGPYQPLDGDLTALAALTGTNTIYYRSGADTWSPVTISTGLSFSGGALSCTVSISGLATLASPVFTGDPQAPTPATADNDTSIATTAFVKAQGYAPLASPVFTGDPQAPTPATADNDTSIATTAFVKAQGYGAAVPPATVAPLMDGTAAVGSVAKYAKEDHVHPTDTSRAPLASPVFTGDPQAPTPTAGDNDNSIATTAFVTTGAALKVAKAGDTMSGDLEISKSTPAIFLSKSASGQASQLWGRNGSLARWVALFGNATSEAGSNSGSDFEIWRYNDAGTVIGTAAALSINRANGGMQITGDLKIYKSYPQILLDHPNDGSYNVINGYMNGSQRRSLKPGNDDAESGSNAGSNWTLQRYSDAGALLGMPLKITRSDGRMVLEADPNTALGAATKQYVDGPKIGVTTNSNAAAGYIGEYVESEVASGSGVSLTSGVVANITSLSLTAGDWDVWGWIGTTPAGSTTTQFGIGFIHDVSASFTPGPNKGAYVNPVMAALAAGVSLNFPTGQRRFSLASTTTIYLELYAGFSVSTMTGYGGLYARRVR